MTENILSLLTRDIASTYNYTTFEARGAQI